MKKDLKASLFVIGLCVAVAFLVYIAANKALFDMEENGCEMTYMFEYPKYIKVNLKKRLSNQFPRYALYIYGEGHYADELKRSKPSGIPVLFIPGNAGSHRQVRSLASVALRKAETKTNHFNYFTVDFDEDLGGLYGGVLMQQANFVHSCLRHILRMYQSNTHPPESVVIIGHSMGGLIAQALFTLEGFQPRLVHFIITLGTPHVAPVLAFDEYLTLFYAQVNNFWLKSPSINNVTIISLAGGSRDILVPAKLCSLSASQAGLHYSAVTTAVPDVWLTIDHLALCWCKQLILVINRALFDMIDKKTNQIRKKGTFQRQVLEQHFGFYKEENDWNTETSHDNTQSIDDAIISNQTVLDVGPQYELSISGMIMIPIRMHNNDVHFMALASDMKNVLIKTCRKVEKKTCNGSMSMDFSFKMLPTFNGKAAFFHLSANTLAKSSHLVVSTLKHKSPSSLVIQFTSKNNINKIFTNFTIFSGSQTFFSANNILTNISLPMVRNCFDVFLISVQKVNCESGNKGLFIGRVHFPWFNEDIYASPSQSGQFDIILKVHTLKPITVSSFPQLHIWDADKCSFEVVVQHQLTQTLGHMFLMYASYIPQWIYFWLMIILTIQIAEMSDKGIWLSIWLTVISFKLLKMLPLFVLIVMVGEVHSITVHPYFLVNSFWPYDWLLPGSFIMLTAFVVLVFLNFILGLIISCLTRLLWFCFSKREKSQNKKNICSYLMFYGFFGSSLFCLSFLCCSSAVYLLTFLTFIHCCKKSVELKRLLLLEETIRSAQTVVCNQLNFSKTLLVLLVVISFQTTPAFIMWLKALPTSLSLPSDSFYYLVLLLTPTVICLLEMDLKQPEKSTSWLILLIWCVSFLFCSLDRLVSICAFLLLITAGSIFFSDRKHVKTC